SLDFFTAATKDVDLSFRAEIDYQDTNALAIRIAGSAPIFDLRRRAISCVSKIEIEPVAETLAPIVTELEFRGGVFRSDWTMNLKEPVGIESNGALILNETARTLPRCLGGGRHETTSLLGSNPRPQRVNPQQR